MRHHRIWVDALLGTGLNAEVKGLFREVIELLNSLNRPVIAVDIPSGLNADTGMICGACIRAHTTVTFGFPKIGHILFPGAEVTGRSGNHRYRHTAAYCPGASDPDITS